MKTFPNIKCVCWKCREEIENPARFFVKTKQEAGRITESAICRRCAKAITIEVG